jgi:hypothetical protein
MRPIVFLFRDQELEGNAAALVMRAINKKRDEPEAHPVR